MPRVLASVVLGAATLVGLLLVGWGALLSLGAFGRGDQAIPGAAGLGLACMVVGAAFLFFGVRGLYRATDGAERSQRPKRGQR